MNLFKKINDKLLGVFNWVMFLSSSLMCGMIVIGAIMRYILKMDFYGSEELILFAAFWMYYIGSAVASYEDSHITADLVRTAMKNKIALAVHKIFRLTVSLFLFGLLANWAVNFLIFSISKGQTTSVYKLPMAISQSALLVSFVFSIIYTIMHLVIAVGELKAALQARNNGEVEA